MINTNDIGTRFLDTRFNRVVTLRAVNTMNGVLMGCVFDPTTPATIPGLNHYWVRATSLSPVEGN